MSFIYRSPFFYQGLMRFLYGKDYEERYAAIAELIPEGASVVDICCGDCFIYEHWLKAKQIQYLGLDQSPAFEKYAQKKGIPFRCVTISSGGEIPPADYVLMMASLYQFIPRQEAFVESLLHRARRGLILCEPVSNLARSSNPFLRTAARCLTHPAVERFEADSLLALFKKFGVARWFKIGTGREIVGFFEKPENR